MRAACEDNDRILFRSEAYSTGSMRGPRDMRRASSKGISSNCMAGTASAMIHAPVTEKKRSARSGMWTGCSGVTGGEVPRVKTGGWQKRTPQAQRPRARVSWTPLDQGYVTTRRIYYRNSRQRWQGVGIRDDERTSEEAEGP